VLFVGTFLWLPLSSCDLVKLTIMNWVNMSMSMRGCCLMAALNVTAHSCSSRSP